MIIQLEVKDRNIWKFRVVKGPDGAMIRTHQRIQRALYRVGLGVLTRWGLNIDDAARGVPPGVRHILELYYRHVLMHAEKLKWVYYDGDE